MKNNKEKKRPNFFIRLLIKLFLLCIIFVASVVITRYYFSGDSAVEETNLSNISLDNIYLNSKIDNIDLSKYTDTDTVQENCNNNYKELGIKTNTNREIEYIITNTSKVSLNIDGETNLKRITDVQKILGNDCKIKTYSKDNNHQKIAIYEDRANSTYLGVVYSRYNNEIIRVILSTNKID